MVLKQKSKLQLLLGSQIDQRVSLILQKAQKRSILYRARDVSKTRPKIYKHLLTWEQVPWWGGGGWKSFLTFLAHQQRADQPRADVLRSVDVRMVHPGQAVGICRRRGILFSHWPDVSIVFARRNHIIILVLSRCSIWVQGSFQERIKHG